MRKALRSLRNDDFRGEMPMPHVGQDLLPNSLPPVRTEQTPPELYSLLPSSMVEQIGLSIDNLHSVGQWNKITALRNPSNPLERNFHSAVSMVNDRLIRGDRITDELWIQQGKMTDYDEEHDPLLFGCIQRAMTDCRLHGNMHAVMGDIVRRFPGVMTLWNHHGMSPLHFILEFPSLSENELKALMYDQKRFADEILCCVNCHEQTPLHLGLRQRHNLDIIHNLIDTKEEVLGMTDENHRVPLHVFLRGCTNGFRMPLFDKLKSTINNKHPPQALNTQDIHDQTPLHVAISLQSTTHLMRVVNQIVPALIDDGQEVLMLKNKKRNAGGFTTDTPLHMALRRERSVLSMASIELLIDHNQKVLSLCSSLNPAGEPEFDTPLHLAIKGGMNFDSICLFIDEQREALLMPNAANDTPLHTSLRKCTQHENTGRALNMDIIVHLMSLSLQKDVDFLRRTGNYGDTVLHIALKNNASSQLVNKLVKHRKTMLLTANSNNYDPAMDDDEVWQSQADYPLHIALQFKREDVFECLIDEDNEVLKRTNCHGDTPLHAALKCAMPVRVIHELLQRDQSILLIPNRIDIDNEERCGDTPLHLAMKWSSCTEILDLLLSNAAVLEIPDTHGNLPLHTAVQMEFPLNNILCMMPEKTLDNYQNHQGQTPLHVAVCNREVDMLVLRLLLPSSSKRKNTHRYKQREFLAEMRETRNLLGETPLFTAVKHGLLIEKITLLIDGDGLLLLIANEMEETPFYAAVENPACSIAVVDLLLPNATQPDLRTQPNIAGITPLLCAIQNFRPLSIIELCIDQEHQQTLFMGVAEGNDSTHRITPLQLFIQTNPDVDRVVYVAIIGVLVDKHRKILTRKNLKGQLPLHYILMQKCHETAIQLVKLLFPTYHRVSPPLAVTEYANAVSAKKAADKYARAGKEYLEMIKCDGETPLHLAIRCGYSAKVLKLILEKVGPAKNAVLQQLDSHGNTALCLAISLHRNAAVLKMLVDDDEKVLFIAENTGQHGISPRNYPIHLIMQSCQSDGILWPVLDMVDRNARVLEKVNAAKQTPLHYALSQCPFSGILDTLLGLKRKNASNALSVDNALQVRDANGYTVLQRALILYSAWDKSIHSREDGLDLIQDMIDTGKKVLLLRNEYNECPLHVALESTYKRFALTTRSINLRMLVDKNQEALKCVDWNNATPLAIALGRGCVDQALLRGMIDKNEDVLSMADITQSTPLHIVIEKKTRDVGILRLLLGSKPREWWNERNSLQQTPLHLALYNSGDAHVVDVLLSSENRMSLLTAVDIYKRTPLHAALFAQAEPAEISILLPCPPEVLMQRDAEGNTPLHLALLHDRTLVWNVLSIHDVDRLQDEWKAVNTMMNDAGNTPLHIALENIPIQADMRYIAVLRSLIDHHGIVVATANKAGKTPIHMIPPQFDLQNVDHEQMTHAIVSMLSEAQDMV